MVLNSRAFIFYIIFLQNNVPLEKETVVTNQELLYLVQNNDFLSPLDNSTEIHIESDSNEEGTHQTRYLDIHNTTVQDNKQEAKDEKEEPENEQDEPKNEPDVK